jgi:hypothetical protein
MAKWYVLQVAILQEPVLQEPILQMYAFAKKVYVMEKLTVKVTPMKRIVNNAPMNSSNAEIRSASRKIFDAMVLKTVMTAQMNTIASNTRMTEQFRYFTRVHINIFVKII